DEAALCAAIGGRCSSAGATHSRVCASLLEKPRAKVKSVLADEIQGTSQPRRCLYASSFSSGACETRTNVTSRARRWGSKPSTVSAIDEQVGQPASYLGHNTK